MVNHLFRLGPSIPWRTVSHNQMVDETSSPKNWALSDLRSIAAIACWVNSVCFKIRSFFRNTPKINIRKPRKFSQPTATWCSWFPYLICICIYIYTCLSSLFWLNSHLRAIELYIIRIMTIIPPARVFQGIATNYYYNQLLYILLSIRSRSISLKPSPRWNKHTHTHHHFWNSKSFHN